MLGPRLSFINIAVLCTGLEKLFNNGSVGLLSGSIQEKTCQKNWLCKQNDLTQLREEITDTIQRAKSELDAEIKSLKRGLLDLKNAVGMKSTCDEIGCTEEIAARSCQQILEDHNIPPPDGLYWIKLSRSESKRVYCDMTTQGGGWALVWSFTYTDYENFAKKTNAVTPRPSGNLEAILTPEGIASVTVPESTTPPEREDQLGALEFKHWKTIGGNNFVVKSNLINWISCKELTGSLTVEFKDGSIECEVIKVVRTNAPECKDVAPSKVWWTHCGVVLQERKNYMKFSINPSCICQMDPCGEANNTRYIKNLDSPRVNVFIKLNIYFSHIEWFETSNSA